MLLKAMFGSSDNSRPRGFRITEDVQEIRFYYHETGEAALDVQYSRPNRGLESETFTIREPMYLMSNEGKTIETFHPADLNPKS